MAVGLLGRKVGMTQIFDEKGKIIPATVIQAGPCKVLALRTMERDGYRAMQLGYLDKPRRLATRAERGHVAEIDSKRSSRLRAAGAELRARAGGEPQRFVREVPLEDGEQFEVGQELTVQALAEVGAVDVTGTTKGRGFTGVMKRHNFKGLGASHGVQRHHRAGGSIAAHATNRGKSGKIKKGKRMAGHYGAARCTVRNVRVVKVDLENHLIVLYGAIPGATGGYLVIRKTNKRG